MSTSAYSHYRAAFVEALAQSLGVPASEIDAQVKPADPAHGDLSFPTFPLAKAQKKAPPAIAAGLAQNLKVPGLEIVAAGPYVNARFSLLPFTAEVIDAARAQGTRYGGGDSGAGKTVVMDYSSPNIAKPIAFHHIRSTVIGHAVANLHRALGYRVEGINYLGDWGKQFGLVAVGFQEYGDPAKRQDMAHLVKVYVQANQRAEKEPAFDERARDFFRRMEANDAEALALWKEFRETSIRDFLRIYARLGIRFEHIEGESFYQDKMEPVIAEISRTVGVKQSEGALIVDLPYEENEPPVLLKKNDGSTLYATRDLAAAIDRHERFHFDKSLYVVATDQSLHFRQLFRVLKAMGRDFVERMVHVNFGRVHGMSTRQGNVVLLTDVLDEARSRALALVKNNIEEGKIQTDDPEALAEQIGLGAIFFGDLKNRRATDYTFDWDEILNFTGHTGAYLQYAHARACNILRKGGGAPTTYDASRLTLPEEQAVLRAIARLPVVVQEAADQQEPSYVARWLLDLAAEFSRYYTLGNQDRAKRVLLEGDEPLKQARLALTDATRAALAAGLTLLGIATPENM
ncbi:Arginyl-tRNA synthetase [Cystobacter fuscus DSM 2262]|uniref:Arginine--tRNA ligase n=1 Tax=Cystobacter fuscus (strain ATCC 25194 / DSM 2262 / NBRC 100088 / M29) TaxID=1242864 RepID=S9Q1W9_CYSF2|nr:arginine--tRNA ligase [Cystobacter fuscus]EPX55299.1 Arginyl-tRNA synthetase [Cystobacter fuscus DSM 2262]